MAPCEPRAVAASPTGASAHAAPGTALEAEVRGKRIGLTVAALPFVPHRYVRKGATA